MADKKKGFIEGLIEQGRKLMRIPQAERQAPKPSPAPKGTMSGSAGNYRAPVDTVGMDPDMIATLRERDKGKK